jgi:putative hydrolase of the HAD superfamily
MSRIRAVVVDLGGVIFLPDTTDFWASIAGQLGLPDSTVREALLRPAEIEAANVGALSAEVYAERGGTRLGTPASAILDAIERVYSGTLNQPLVGYLRGLKAAKTVAALTNNWSFLDRLLRRHDIADLFSVIVNSADVGVCKPSEQVFDILLDRLHYRADEVVFLDDDLVNVNAARALGFAAIHFQTTDSALAQLDALL